MSRLRLVVARLVGGRGGPAEAKRYGAWLDARIGATAPAYCDVCRRPLRPVDPAVSDVWPTVVCSTNCLAEWERG